MTQQIPLGKRTKQEILDAYEQLQGHLDELQTSAKVVHSQPALELVERSTQQNAQTIETVFMEFQKSLHAHISDVRTAILEQSALLQELQQAVGISRQQLQLQHGITVAAESLEELMAEQKRKMAEFASEGAQKKQEYDEQITQKRKAWEREAEEYEYNKKLQRERDRAEADEREKSFAVREEAIRQQEQEIAQMKKSLDRFPQELSEAVAKKEKEVLEKLTEQFTHEKALMEKESTAQMHLFELKVANLEERLAANTQEIIALKRQTEEANAKAQVLAMKAIERPTTIVSSAPATQHNQGS